MAQFNWIAGSGALTAASNWANVTAGQTPSLSVPGGADSVVFIAPVGNLTNSLSVTSATFAGTGFTLAGTLAGGTVAIGTTGVAGQLAIGGTLIATAATAAFQVGINSQLQLNPGGAVTATSLSEADSGNVTIVSARLGLTGGANMYSGTPLGADLTNASVFKGGTLDSSTGLVNIGVNGTASASALSPTVSLFDASAGRALTTVIGSNASRSGTLSLTNAATWTDVGATSGSLVSQGSLVLGTALVNGAFATAASSGAALVSVSNGASLTETTQAVVGVGTGSSGQAIVSSGGTWTIGTILDLGLGGKAGVTVSNGGTVRSLGPHITGIASVRIGDNAASSANVLVTGSNSVLDSGGDRISVGVDGQGTLTVTAGAKVLAGARYSDIEGAGYVGLDTGSNGQVSIADPGSVYQLAGQLNVATSGTGSVTIRNGGSLVATGLLQGINLPSNGQITVDGPNSLLSVSGGYFVAGGSLYAGSAASKLTVTNGGSVSVGTLTLYQGSNGVSLDATSRIEIGGSGQSQAGAIVIDGAGTLQAAGTVQLGTIVDNGVISAYGGTLTLVGSIASGGRVQIGNGGALVTTSALSTLSIINFGAAGNATLVVTGTQSASTVYSGFAATDVVDFAGVVGTSATVNGNTLALQNGTTTVATAQVTGLSPSTRFVIASDGAGGTSVSLSGTTVNTSALTSGAASIVNTVIAGFVAAQGPLTVTQSGAQFATAPGTGANVGQVTPTSGAVLSLPTAYSAGILLGIGSATLIDAAGGKLLVANNGNDTLVGTGANDTVIGGSGNDVLYGGPGGGALLYGGTGANTIVGGAGATQVVLNGNGSGAFSGTGPFTLTDFSNGSFVVEGTAQSVIYAAGSGGLYYLGSAANILVAGGGFNTVVGGSGQATVFDGTAGGLYFSASAPMIFVGSTNSSTIVGGSAADVVFGGPGGSVTLFGTASGNILVAGSGNTTLNGSQAFGGNVFFGGSGNTVLDGGQASDFFTVGTGNATVNAGVGADLISFIRGAAGGTYTINNFNQAIGDKLVLVNFGSGAAQTALAGAQSSAAGVTVTLSDDSKILLSGVTTITGGAFG